jgi:hypothetical protein
MTYIPSNINEMMGEIYRDSLIYANRFEMVINTPTVFSYRPASQKQMTLRCNSASIPGRSLTTQNYRFYGPQRQFPTEPLYSGDLALTYILSADLKERAYFEEWLNFICNPSNYKFSFYDEYTTSGVINILDKTDQVVYSATIEEMYPKQIGEIALGYEKDNEFLTQDIVLAYRKYTPATTAVSNPPTTTQAAAAQQITPFGLKLPESLSQILPPAQQTASRVQQVFGIDPKTGRINRYGSDGTVNGVINGQG